MTTRYLLPFDDGAMTFPEEDLPDVAKAAHKVFEQGQERMPVGLRAAA